VSTELLPPKRLLYCRMFTQLLLGNRVYSYMSQYYQACDVTSGYTRTCHNIIKPVTLRRYYRGTQIQALVCRSESRVTDETTTGCNPAEGHGLHYFLHSFAFFIGFRRELKLLGRYSDDLQAGRPGLDSRQGQETFLFFTESGSGSHRVTYTIGTDGSFPEGKATRA
jgi:hypothetical protein